MVVGRSVVDRLGGITAPTLVTVGRHDLFCSPAQSARIASRIRGARLEVFDHGGHSPFLEEPDRFRAVLLGWLDGFCPSGPL